MTEGISFLCRIRDEERTIEQSLQSIYNLNFPHEIVCILHRCSDRSEEIVRRISETKKNIKIYHYDDEISRPGYETLATDANSKHSYVEYMNWCLSKCSLPWVFKWDADFIASPTLFDFLNTETWSPKNITYRIAAKNTTHSNWETYLICNSLPFKKHVFWEVRLYPRSNELITLPEDVCIIHDSELTDVKTYWNNKPWYDIEETEEAYTVKERIQKLENEFGKEPLAMARASNPVCNKIYRQVIKNNPVYVNLYN
jgi:hypothetical protein